MSCNISIDTTSIENALREYTGNNETLFSSYWTEIRSKHIDGYTSEFVNLLKEKGVDINNISNNQYPLVIRAIKEIYNRNNPSVTFDTKLDDKDSEVARFGYSSIDARDEGKRHVVNFMLNVRYKVENEFGDKIKGSKKQFYADQTINKFEDYLIDRLSNKYTEDEIWDGIEAETFDDLDKMVTSLNDVQTSNLYALYKEMRTNREAYFASVFDDSRLGDIRFDKNDNNSEDSTYEYTETEDDGNEDEGEEGNNNDNEAEQTDKTTKRWDNSLGDNVANYLSEVDSDVKSYLGSLKKLNSGLLVDGKRDENTNNWFGIADVMNVEECCAILYSEDVDYTNRETMLNSIRDIANNVPGFQAFHQIIDDCKNNIELSYKLYNTFAKFVVNKIETISDGNITTSRTSNRNVSKRTTLRFEFTNSIKTTSLQNDDVSAKSLKAEIDKKRKRLNELQDTFDNISSDDTFDVADRLAIYDEIDIIKKEIISDIASQLKNYYPTIEETTIANYVEKNNEGNFKENIDNLLNILTQTINGNYATQYAYNARALEIDRAYRHNAKKENKNNQKDIKEFYNLPYISNDTQTAAIKLADEIVNFSPVHTELNSRNVHGNQSSDIINNNMITNLMNILKSTISTKNYGNYKSMTRQYDFSNIMIEHKEDGKIVNFGLFTRNEVTNEFEPTPYAHRLLQARLFNGATDAITSKNVLYKEMSKGDYVATSFINFFNVESDFSRDKSNDIKVANYFMRIPSDAPKNFIITAPKYSSNGLFNISNQNEVSIEVNRRINSLTRPEFNDQEEALQYMVSVNDVSYNKIRYHITSKNPGNIVINKRSQLVESDAKVGDEVSITYQYKDKNGNTEYYVMKGTLERENGNDIISNPKFYSFLDFGHISEINNMLSEHFTKQLDKEGFIKKEINTNHVLFKQIRNMFVQELTDAANAINLIFQNKDGIVDVNLDTNEPIFNVGFDNTEESARQLYAVYHVGKKGTILEKTIDGKYKLTGRVFGSDRFQIAREVNGKIEVRNYGQEIIDEAFDFLYGGASNLTLKTTLGPKGVSVQLNDAQNNKINEKLTQFIIDYIADTERRLNQYSEFIPAKYQTRDNIAEFALNHHIMFGNFNDLFEGDTKFYRDVQTFLKRAKEAQAGGIPYGNTNYAINMLEKPTNVPSRLDLTEFTAVDANGNTSIVKYQLKNKFVGITVKNSIRPNKDLEVEGVNGAKKDGALVLSLAEAITESFRKDGMKVREAKALAIEKARDIVAGVERDGRHGYHGTKVNDAQSYITFEEWVKRITARGQFMKYKPLIEAILDESKPIDIKTINEFVQVQKNFYYDQYYNDKNRTMAPRQIKNAEFVLVPRFIRGTQLEQVYKLMKDNEIDQLNTEETSKAGKANVLTIWNDNGEITKENLDDFNARVKDSTEYFSYNNLYTQQETPQHINSQNKAGIQIMKKILDNIDENTWLGKIKRDFFKNYVANIKESFNDVVERLGIELDENGNIQRNKETGEIEGLDKQVLFDLLKQEMIRQGLDSNALDYVTLNNDENSIHNGITVVPTYFSNKAAKLESISQSIFNNSITRQKLPGFHAAQITSIGFTPLRNKVKNRKYSDDLQYHPKEYQLKNGSEIITEREYLAKTPAERKQYEYIGTANYIEIMLPANNFNLERNHKDGTPKSNEELLQELHEAGMDMIIGYRIPTEGKQSICIMKVVGFTDDTLGSTIVVPDMWVAQTGSDFDIDSVYGIHFKGRINKRTGKLEKIEYHNEATKQDYIRYILRRANNITKPNKQKQIAALKENIQETRTNQFEALHEDENEYWGELPNELRKIISKVNREGGKTKNKQEYLDKNNKVLVAIDNYIKENDIKGKDKKQILKYRDIIEQINSFLTNSQDDWQQAFDEGIENINQELFKSIEQQAYELGLPTYGEFVQFDATEFNNKDARNNRILEDMIEILSSSEAMEENFSRSNFEDIISARDNAIDKRVKDLRDARSPYNFLDQAEYQEDVMSGAKLKAFSVTRDTFCSICNTIKPKLLGDNVVSIVYRKEDGYSFEQLKNSFEDVTEVQPGVYKVAHNTFGWSKNNRNTVGKLITAYSSQTTAHILDAVKEGAIPNVNDYTFQVYKMFPDLGSDYATGVSFIMQNGISEIVLAYNENKSIYARNNSNPVNTAFKRIAKRFLKLNGIDIKENARLDEYYDKLKPFSKELATLFGASKNEFVINLSDKEVSKLLISSSRQHRRLKEEGEFTTSPVGERNKLLFDLGVILQFNHLNHIGSAIGNYTRVCNPDKFGAKQSIFATEKVFDDIKEIIYNNQKNILSVTKNLDGRDYNISLLEAIYPGLRNIDVVNAENFLASDANLVSAYPSLNAFLRYATAMSIVINRSLFETQDKDFVAELKEIQNLFSNRKLLNEKIYKDLQSYTLNYLYNQVDAIAKPVIYQKDKGFVWSKDGNLEEERRRIYGYGKTARLDVVNEEGNVIQFNVKDINNPTEQEIKQFATLSPAQKVFWIQSKYKDAGVFKYLKVSLFNDKQSGNVNAGAQTIRYIENNNSIETVYNEFNQAFYNNNPLVAMAAMDIIKYAFVVEGYKMKRNAVNKMISNKPLIDRYENNGTNIIAELNDKIGDIKNASINMQQIRENFIRSHSELSQIDTRRVEKNDKGIWELRLIDNMIYFSNSQEDLDLALKYGFLYDNQNGGYNINKYIKLRFSRDIRLYKIIDNDNTGEIVAIPLNKLESNENSNFSVNNSNNKFNDISYYETIANDWFARQNTEEDIQEFIKNYKDLRAKTKFKPNKTIDKGAITFDINEKGTVNTSAFNVVIDAVNEHFSTTVKEPLYIRVPAFTKYIKYYGYSNGTDINVNGKKYFVYKYNAKDWNKYISENKQLPEKKLKLLNQGLQDIIINAHRSSYLLNDVYIINKVAEETNLELEEDEYDANDLMGSTVVEFNGKFVDDIQTRAIEEGDEDVVKIVQTFKDKDITIANAGEQIHVNEVVSLATKYIVENVNDILNEFKYYEFIKFINDDGTKEIKTVTIDDVNVIETIRNNPELRDRFLKTILKARAFIKNYELINELDIDSNDEDIKNNLNKIKKAINQLRNSNIINKAEENFANEYLAKLSDNPLVRQNVINLLDGYHSSSALDAWINDMQETSNPLLQIVTKEVMADIRAKEMKAFKKVEKIKRKIADIKEQARKAGISVDWGNIVDSDGKLIQDYTSALVDKIDELREAINVSKKQFGEGSLEHLKAQHEYNKFKLNHINQELVDDYYQDRLELDEHMIKNYPTIFEEYKKLESKRRKIFQLASNGILEGELLNQYKDIKQEIDNLVRNTYYDAANDIWVKKKDGSDPTNPFKHDARLLNIYNSIAAKNLREYLEKNKELSKLYFRDNAKYGFEEDLERNLEIVKSYEKRVNGRITTPANVLEMHDDYLKAKSWLETNARWVINEELNDKLNAAYKELREAKRGRERLKLIAKNKNLYDSRGIIKADELTDEDIRLIREEQLDNYGLKEGQPWQDKSLISNAPTDDTVFKLEFYKGMKSNGVSNPEYIAKVAKINAILEKHYDSATRTLYTSELSESELRDLIDLYSEIEDISKTKNSTNGKEIWKYINKNVDYIIDEAKYNEQKRLVQGKSARYKALWSLLNERVEEVNGVDQLVPNRVIYGYAVPKGYKPDGTDDNSMVDKNKTEALRTIYKHTQTLKTTYYYKKFKEMSNKSQAEFDEWYKNNHVYNPYTRTYEPLSCWTTVEIVSDDPNEVVGQYMPGYFQTDSEPKDEYLNPNYKGRNSSTASNFKTEKNLIVPNKVDFSDNIDYSNNNAMNEYERKLKELVEEIIKINAKSTNAKRFFKQGYMIARAKKAEKDATFIAKEAVKMLGWIDTSTGKETWTKDEDVDFATDKSIEMPFTTQLKNKDSKKLSYKVPTKKPNETDNEYQDRLDKWKEDNNKIKEENAKIHAELLDRDFESVIEDFIIKSAHYNAIQDNKYMLFYAKNMLDKLEYYVKNEGFNNLQRDARRSTDDNNIYVTKKDTRLQEQYINWIRRLVYDQWKKPNNKLTRAANIAQSLTSAKFMMLNVTGGIANVTVGSTQIYAEMIANEYFGRDTAAKGLATWSANIGSFIADMYSDKASSTASAIIKFFNVIDFDELNGIVSVADAEEYMKRARDIAFSPQATGEHMMQNGALFAMLHSHRLIANPDHKLEGRLNYRFMNEAEYLNEKDEQALFDILDDNQKNLFFKFKNRELSDANRAKEYAWFRKYLTVEFANFYLNDEQKRDYIKQRRKLQDEARKEFNNDEKHPTIISQLKLDEDGKLGFKDDSKLAEIGEESYKLLGYFKGRVISVNKKIHGVYDKLGAAQLEKYWWGGLVMQYHKHIYPGLMKRYRRQGYFNEERGTIEKGAYAAIKDFLSIPLHKTQYAKKIQEDNNMTDEELKAVVGIQNIVKNYVEFATHVRLYWNIIPENERGNIKRALGDFAGTLSAICTAIGLRCLADDDEDGLAYNLAMYEADRLASESMMYNPFGLVSEGKKLWSSPVAVQGAISDLFHTVGFISQYIIQGDEFDGTYQTGLYAGENKASVFIKRNIPMYHSVYMLERLQRSNKYYKLGENMLTLIPIKDIAEFITD